MVKFWLRFTMLACLLMSITIMTRLLMRTLSWSHEPEQHSAATQGIHNKFAMSVQHDTERGGGSSTPRRIPRILCLLLATEREGLIVEAVNTTWTRRCNKTLYIYASSKEPHLLGDKLFVKVREGIKRLPAKVKAAFQFVHQHFNSSFDWFLKADVDTYVIMENLRLLLATRDPSQSILLGRHLKKSPNKIGYMSGGAGYVLSARALKDLVENAIGGDYCKDNNMFYYEDNEDIAIATCLESVNVTLWSSMDTDRKETFHAEPLSSYLAQPIPEWLKEYSWHKAKYGTDCCSNFSITFHHLEPRDIYMYEHLLYNTRVNNRPLRQNVFQNAKEMTRPKSRNTFWNW